MSLWHGEATIVSPQYYFSYSNSQNVISLKLTQSDPLMVFTQIILGVCVAFVDLQEITFELWCTVS